MRKKLTSRIAFIALLIPLLFMGCHDSGDELEKPNLEAVAALNQTNVHGNTTGMMKYMSGPTDFILVKTWGTPIDDVSLPDNAAIYVVLHSRPLQNDEVMPDYTTDWSVSGVAQKYSSINTSRSSIILFKGPGTAWVSAAVTEIGTGGRYNYSMSTTVYPILAIESPKTTIVANEVISLGLNSNFSKVSGKTIAWSSTSSGFRVISGNGTANPKIAFSTIGSKTVKVKVTLNGAPSREATVNFNVMASDIKPPTLIPEYKMTPDPHPPGSFNTVIIIASHDNPLALYEWKHTCVSGAGSILSSMIYPDRYKLQNIGRETYAVEVKCRAIISDVYSEWATYRAIVPCHNGSGGGGGYPPGIDDPWGPVNPLEPPR